ncbi:MAG: GAF domain-containing protein [Acidimicrobiales bacterium]
MTAAAESGDPAFLEMRVALGAAVAGTGGPLALADRLCEACVEHLDVDGAAVSFIIGGSTRGTFGSSGPQSRTLDELQFTFGEGPCLDAVLTGQPVLAPDLDDPEERRWPGLLGAVRDAGVRALFAMPVNVATSRVGALDLFRNKRGPLGRREMHGAMLAAELAALPLLEMITDAGDRDPDSEMGDPWPEIASLERVEVYQATGMIMVQLGVDATEALVRLRGHAASRDLSVSEIAWAVIERRLRLDADDGWRSQGSEGSS